MIEFLLEDNYPEPNCEEYNYLVKINIDNTDYTREKILDEIDNFINSIEEYEVCVTEYLEKFLDDKNLEYEIKAIRDLDKIYY